MTYPTFIAIDTETTLNGNDEVGLAHPMHPDNYVVAVGVSTSAGNAATFRFKDKLDLEKNIGACVFSTLIPGVDKVENVWFVGHNLSFDLLYLYRADPKLKESMQEHKVWDTQLAEYILTGQQSKFSSLDELCIKYGLPTKEDKIKEYFQSGLGADKIPWEELEPYLRLDVSNAHAIATKQYEQAVANDQLTLIESQMEAFHATTEMMFNGLTVDQETLNEYTVQVVNQYAECKTSLESRCVVEDINSPKQWSTYFFGGTKKVKVKEAVGIFKNGNTKYKLVEKEVKIPRAILYTPDPDKISAKTGQVSVDDSVLKDMLNHTTNESLKETIKGLLEYRELSKQLSTYVQGLSKHFINGCIHGKLNHTATVTGRLSSTSPNLQNISNNPIKKIFVSRYKEGFIVEVDFNQLEVVALAHITKDKQLIEDITKGVDIHSALYKGLFGRMPTKEERKPFKARTFQLIYGAGAKAIAKQAGCPLDEAKRFIDVFYARYPSVAKWHEEFAKEVDLNGKHLRNTEGLLDRHKTSVHTTKTGRRYVFLEYFQDSPYSSKSYSFSPTEMKNYPVQGLATGDCVPLMLGVLFRKFLKNPNVKIINTIHDSVLFDVASPEIGHFIIDVLDLFRSTHRHFERTFKHPLALPLNASASYGANWFEMIECDY